MKVFLSLALALWVGGLAFFMLVVAPVSFRTLGKEEAGRILGFLFPVLDRWGLACGAAACMALYGVFLRRHFEPRSLLLEVPVAMMFLLTLHVAVILHPQIRDIRDRVARPEYEGTARQGRLQFVFRNLHRRSVQIHMGILALGLFSVGVFPYSLCSWH